MADDESNVIRFGVPGIPSADLGEPTDMSALSLKVLVNSIESYGFECEAGPLANCTEWIELRRRVGASREKWS